MFDLTGKTALITGASGGIGGSIARVLHGAGARILGVALNKVDMRFDGYYGTYYHAGYYSNGDGKRSGLMKRCSGAGNKVNEALIPQPLAFASLSAALNG